MSDVSIIRWCPYCDGKVKITHYPAGKDDVWECADCGKTGLLEAEWSNPEMATRHVLGSISKRRKVIAAAAGVEARPAHVVSVEIEELTQGLTHRVDAGDLAEVAQDVLEVAALCCEYLERMNARKDRD